MMQICPDPQSAAQERRFERWLSIRLHAAHDAPLHEPVPVELAQLVQLFAADDSSDARARPEASVSSPADRQSHCQL